MLTIPNLAIASLHRPGADYGRDVAADYQSIEGFLPGHVDSILDIGCGLAGIDVLLKRRYPKATLNLLDGEGTKPYYGWNAHCPPYGSRVAAEELLEANGVRADRWIEAGTDEELSADLVISLLAWGFHFPLSTYRVHGLCVADLRLGHETARGTVIARHRKSVRCIFQC